MAILSIVVPVYNVDKYLTQCIESIILQTFSDFQLILVNDGSTDDSANICDKFSTIDHRIEVIHKKNEGLVSARKSGLRIANGKYIGNIDGDDWIEKNMFELLVTAAELYSSDVVMCGIISDYPTYSEKFKKQLVQGGIYNQKLDQLIFNKILYSSVFFEFGIYPNLVNKIFLREKYMEFQLKVDNRITIGEDLACSFPYLLSSKNIVVLEDDLYHYRRIETSMTNKYQVTMGPSIEYLFNFLEDYKVIQQYLESQLPYYYLYLLSSYIKNELSSKNQLSCYEKNKKIKSFNKSNIMKYTNKNLKFKNVPRKNLFLFLAIKNFYFRIALICILRIKTFVD